ncbi:MAG: type II toxin-antitoxin system RelE/ParE family toxin [Lacunisphaera sp.]
MNRWYHPKFETDLIDAARYYQGQVPVLGAAFLDEAESALEEIMRAPERWLLRIGGVRRFLLSRFPYVIRYRISKKRTRFSSQASCTALVGPVLERSAPHVRALSLRLGVSA